MSHDQTESNWTPSLLCWVVLVLFMTSVLGWLLTAGVLALFAGTIEQFPLWLRAPVFLLTPLAGGVLAGVLCWRYGRRVVRRVASFLGGVVPMRLGFPLVASLGATAICVIPMAEGLREFLHHRWLGSFRPAAATVTGTRIDEVEDLGHEGFAPRVLYEFRVGDERYTGYKIHWDLHRPPIGPEGGGGPPPDMVRWSRNPSARDSLTDLLRHYPTGKPVTAYYDPADPNNACLVYVPFEPTRHGMGGWCALSFAILFWLFFAFVWVAERRAARKP